MTDVGEQIAHEYWYVESGREVPRRTRVTRKPRKAGRGPALLSCGDAEEGLVDEIGALLQGIDRDAFVVAVHAAQVLVRDRIRINPVDGDAAHPPRERVRARLEQVRRHGHTGPYLPGAFDERAIQIRVHRRFPSGAR